MARTRSTAPTVSPRDRATDVPEEAALARPDAHSLPEPCRDHRIPRGAWALLKELIGRFGRDSCPVYAAALSFFSLFSLVPLLIVALAALAFLYQSPQEALSQLQKWLGSLLPGTAARETVRQIMDQAALETSVTNLMNTRGLAGLIGAGSLLWASIQIFIHAAPAMNAAFEVEETRSWVRLRLLALGLLFGAGTLFALSLLLSAGPALVRRLNIPWLGLPEHVPWPLDLLFALVALLINITMFAIIYRFLPNATTTWKHAFIGGLIAGVFWEGIKQGFAYYLAHFGNYDKLYGTLGGMVALVFWVYYTAMVFLLGAEATSLVRDIEWARRDGPPNATAPLRGQEERAGGRAG